MIDRIAKIVFILAITDLYRVISTITPVSNSIVSIGFIGVTALLINLRIDKLTLILREKYTQVYLLCFLYIPFLINFLSIFTYSSSIEDFMYWSVKIVYFILFSFFTALYVEDIINRKVIIFSVLIVCASFYLNSSNPELFSKIATNYGVTLAYAKYGDIGSRFMGFYLHPNSASLTIFLLMAFLFCLNRLAVFTFLILMTLIIFTGSRTALIIGFIFSGYFFYQTFMESRFKMHVKSGINKMLFVVIASFIFLILAGALLSIADSNFIYRLENIGNFEQDESVMIRAIAQRQYLELLLNNPFLGYGADYIRDLIDKGLLVKPSHNMYIERIVQFGILGLLSFLYYLYSTHNRFKKNEKLYAIIPLLALYSFFINTIDQMLVFYIFAGLAINGKVFLDEDSSCNR